MTFSLTRMRKAFTAHMAEEVTYVPRKGTPRVISAVVDRQPKTSLSEMQGRTNALPFFQIEVENDPATGISADELDTGGDRIEVAVRVGQIQESRAIRRIVSQDEGMIVLEVR